jgi:hypothetical protein
VRLRVHEATQGRVLDTIGFTGVEVLHREPLSIDDCARCPLPPPAVRRIPLPVEASGLVHP